MLLKIKNGLEINRTTIIPEVGEPIITTDTKKLYIGDGITPGGIHLTSSFSNNSEFATTASVLINQSEIENNFYYLSVAM